MTADRGGVERGESAPQLPDRGARCGQDHGLGHVVASPRSVAADMMLVGAEPHPLTGAFESNTLRRHLGNLSGKWVAHGYSGPLAEANADVSGLRCAGNAVDAPP